MRGVIVGFLLIAVALAGCSGGGGGSKGEPTNDDVLDVTEDTGGIRGVVVDQAIKPIVGAVVTLSIGKNTTTTDEGTFTFTGLQAGDYFISAGKPGHKAAQVSTTVVAGDADPPVVRVLLEAMTLASPYLETLRLDGFYECGFALSFITDSCDFAYRTAYDEAHPPVVPRTVNKFSNTQYIFVPADTFTIVQEGFWKSDSVPEFLISLDETPIDNSCDCSDTYQSTQGPNPIISRLERFAPDGSPNTEFHDDLGWFALIGEMPTDVTVASRGFLPPADDPSYAVNFQFTILTTLFHNYVPDPEWTFETRDNYPVG